MKCDCLKKAKKAMEADGRFTDVSYDDCIALTMSGTKGRLHFSARRMKKDGKPKARVEGVSIFWNYCPLCGQPTEGDA